MISHDTDINWHCDYDKCRNPFVLSQNQATRYRNCEAAGTLADKRFYCTRDCARRAGRDAGNERDRQQRIKADEERLQRLMEARGFLPKRRKFTTEDLEAYWQTVADPTYYTTLRYNYSSPLSYRDRNIAIARSTNARS